MRTLIIPCAGKSTRYKTTTPKYLLTHPSGNMMVYESIQGLPLNYFDKIIVTVLRNHMIDDIIEKIKNQFICYENFDLLILDNETTSASETVCLTIEEKKIAGEIYIKDVDDYFLAENLEPNQVCTYSLDDIENITPGNKSYIRKNENNEVLTIVEKKVISSNFCCGLYSFDSAEEFVNTFKNIKNIVDGEIYISHVIFKMLLNGKNFTNNQVKNFIDWGTQKDWDNFNYYYKNEK